MVHDVGNPSTERGRETQQPTPLEPHFYLSPVDYGAWRKGYMPPTEHVLIDQLAYRGARVISMSDLGDIAWWFVVRGKRPSSKAMLAIARLIAADEEEQERSIPDDGDAKDEGAIERWEALDRAGNRKEDNA